MKKILTFGIMLMFLLPLLSSTGISNPDDDIDVKICASRLGTDIGFRIRVKITNNRNENITVYVNTTVDNLLRLPDFNHSHKMNLSGTIISSIRFGFDISRFIISVEGGNTKVMREGLQLFWLYIFFK